MNMIQKTWVQWAALMFLATATTSAAAGAGLGIAKPGCSDTCGNVSIPYPFGIDHPNCAQSPSFLLICNRSSNGDNLLIDNVNLDQKHGVQSISLQEGFIMLFSDFEATYCYNQTNRVVTTVTYVIDFGDSPYRFSNTRNKFITIGCDISAYIAEEPGDIFRSGCISLCGNSTMTVEEDACSGIGCCQSTIPRGLKDFKVFATSTNDFKGINSSCAYAFIIDQDAFDARSYRTRLLYTYPHVSFITWFSLEWVIDNKTCASVEQSHYVCGPNTHCIDSTNGHGYRCLCRTGFDGNPYLQQGCQDIDECNEPQKYPCHGSCTNTPGDYICHCPLGMHGDGKVHCTGFRIATLAAGIIFCFGLVFSFAGLYLLHKYMKKRKHINLKRKFFEKNGGLLLEQQICSNKGKLDRSKIFTAEELEKATDNYNKNRILGQGGQGTVYKGMLSDGTIVAIKKSAKMDESQTKPFINELVILSQINHKNVVKLLGCCLETEVPLLVYEFISNGTLSNHIHHANERCLFKWADRLRIAEEVAGALAYMHSAASVPIYHRDIKSSNILLDEKLRAKVSDFGISRSVPLEKTHLTTFVQGTFGYLDPEYFRSNRFTDKSDVYSYGMVLVELLTGKKPIPTVVVEGERGLAAQFISAIEEKCLFQELDPQVLADGEKEELIIVANLAKRCLELTGRKRPTMMELAHELENLKKPREQLLGYPEEEHTSEETSREWDASSTPTETMEQ